MYSFVCLLSSYRFSFIFFSHNVNFRCIFQPLHLVRLLLEICFISIHMYIDLTLTHKKNMNLTLFFDLLKAACIHSVVVFYL